MRTVDSLIDEAANLCGSDAALARRLGKTRSQIADMRSGAEPISPETVGQLADVVELTAEEARRLAALAIVARQRDPRKAEVLRRAFFVSLALGAVGLALLASTVETMAATPASAGAWWTVYTLCLVAVAGVLSGWNRRSTDDSSPKPRPAVLRA